MAEGALIGENAIVAHERPRRLPGVGPYLVALVLIAVVPLMVIAGILIERQAEAQQNAFERSLLQTAHALSVAVDRQLQSYEVMLETLAESDDLARGNLDAFHALAQRVAARHGAVFISLFSATGEQLFNTLRPAGEPLPTPFDDPRTQKTAGDRPPAGDPTALAKVLSDGRPVVSDLLFGLVAQRLVFIVNVPIMRGGKVAYVLNAAFDPEVMTGLLKDDPEFAGLPAVIFDRHGFIVARWKDAGKFVGTRTSLWSSNVALAAANSSIGVGRTLEGIDVHFAHARSGVTGWGVDVGAARSDVEGVAARHSVIGPALAIGGLCIGLLLALALASRLRTSIAALAASATSSEAPRAMQLQIRELVELQQALTAAAATRKAQIEERERLLVATTRETEAVEANRMKDRFIAVLSHELRNPLAPIRNGIWLLRETNHDPRAAATLEMLDRQSGHLERLVNDLLHVSRISSGLVSLRSDRLDLRAVARQAIEATMSSMNARHHRLIARIGDQPIEIVGDFERLCEVAVILLDNACRYTSEHGTVRLSVQAQDVRAVLAVEDNGNGIAADWIGSIFAGVRPGATAGGARSMDGLGLGLPVAKALVELQGGTLSAQSKGSGTGTTFTVVLPLAEQALG